jgi:hypothetical protein
MRKIAPFLTIALVVAGFWWALEGAPGERPRDRGPGTRRTEPAAGARAQPPESRPESAPATRVEVAEEPESQPESQPESRPESAPVEPVVVFVVTREDGRPIPLATVSLSGDVSDLAQTDETGRAQVYARPGVTVEASVWGEAFYPFVKVVRLDSGTREIVVPTRSTVAGHVSVDGRPPVEPVGLGLYASRDPEAQALPNDLGMLVGPTGRFEFFNLPDRWHGYISIAGEYVLSSEESGTLDVPRPNPELTINLTERPVIKGRLVSNEKKEPIYGSIQVNAESDETGGSGSRQSSQLFSNDAGRFRVYVEPQTTRVTVELSDASRLGTRTIEVAGPFDVVRNLGDVEIGAVRDLVFRVQDAESRPVAGAVASIPATWSKSEPTAEDGRAAIKTDSNKRELRVGKLGYATAVVQLPESLPTTLDVRLERGNQLTIDVKLPNGNPISSSSAVLVLRSDTPMFTGVDGMSEEMFARTGASEAIEEHSVSTGSSWIKYAIEQGRVVVGGLRAGATFAVELRGWKLNDLLVEDFVVMPASGTKELALKAPRLPQVFVGAVRAVDGKPVAEAAGALFLPGVADRRVPAEFQTDAEGRFSVDDLFVDTVGIWIEKSRFVPIVEDRVAFTGGAERMFTMVASRVVTVALVNEQGRPVVEDATVVARFPRQETVEERFGTSLGAGRYEIDELPPGEIDVEVILGATTVIVHHDSRTPLARIVVPTEGTAELHWRRDRGDPVHCKIVLALGGVPLTEIDVPAELGDHWLDMKAPPGVYVAIVEGRDEDSEEWRAIATSKAFEIAAHLATRVELRR